MVAGTLLFRINKWAGGSSSQSLFLISCLSVVSTVGSNVTVGKALVLLNRSCFLLPYVLPMFDRLTKNKTKANKDIKARFPIAQTFHFWSPCLLLLSSKCAPRLLFYVVLGNEPQLPVCSKQIPDQLRHIPSPYSFHTVNLPSYSC